MCSHGTKLGFHQYHANHHYNSKDRVKVIRDGSYKIASPSCPSTNPLTAAAQDEIGAIIHTGAAVASIRYANFALDT